MPELPEVETVVQSLKELEGKKIQSIEIIFPKIFQGHAQDLHDLKIIKISRRGKYIHIELEKHFSLFVHLRMTGRFYYAKGPVKKHEHLILHFKDKELRYHDTRKFGRFFLTQKPETILDKLGPEPFDPNLDPSHFVNRNRALKPLLLDQAFIAGLGNIYVDEALFEAKLHPLTKNINLKQAKLLLDAIRIVLKRGLDTKGTSLGKGLSNFYQVDGSSGDHQHKLKVFRLQGNPCPRCGTILERITVAQRSTHFCPTCQVISTQSHKE